MAEPLKPPAETIADSATKHVFQAVEGVKTGRGTEKSSKSGRSTKISNTERENAKETAQTSYKDQNVSEQQKLLSRDFFWDDWLSYIASAIVALALIDISVEFLAGNRLGLLCLTPSFNDSDEFMYNRDQSAFVNNFCSRYLPLTEFYPLFTLIQGILIYAPHYIWASWFSSYFEFFFALVSTLDRLRQRSTGQYNPRNTTVVKQLEEEFGGRISITLSYFMKLLVQFVIAALMVVIALTEFQDFSPDIICPPNGSNSSLFGRVHCVYSRFRFLRLLLIANVILLFIALVITIGGEVLTFVRSYSDVLGYQKVADFMFHSALHSSHFVPKAKNIACYCIVQEGVHYSSLHVHSDLDFLLVKLFETDAGFGKLFKDIQISIELSNKLEAAYQHLYVMQRRKQRRASGPQGNVLSASPSMEAFIGNVCKVLTTGAGVFAPTNGEKPQRAAIDISFSLHGFAFTIAEHFEAAAALYLDEHYHSETDVVNFKKYSSNMYTLQVPTNILSLPVENTHKLSEALMGKFLDRKPGSRYTPKYKVSFILVSGIDSSTKEATVAQLIETFSGKDNVSIDDNAILLVLTPLRIEGRAPKGFAHHGFKHNEDFWTSEPSWIDDLRSSYNIHKRDNTVQLDCGDTSCVFALSAFKHRVTGYTETAV